GRARAPAWWGGADRVISIRLAYPESRAALAQAERLGRLTTRQLRDAVTDLDEIYDEVDLVDMDDELVRRAGDLAERHALRAYDAVHLAAAVRLSDAEL